MKPFFFFILLCSLTASAQIASTDTAVPSTTDKPYRSTEVDLKPQVKDGNYTLSMFISDNFKFPPAIKNKKITIFSSFVVEADGTMTEIKASFINDLRVIKIFGTTEKGENYIDNLKYTIVKK